MKTLLGLTPWALMIRISMTMKHSKICCDIFTDRIWCGICGFFFLSLWFSRSQVVNFLKWKHHYLRENIAVFHGNDDFFHPIPLFEQKWMSFHDLFMTNWERENERKKEPQIPRLRRKSKQLFGQCIRGP